MSVTTRVTRVSSLEYVTLERQILETRCALRPLFKMASPMCEKVMIMQNLSDKIIQTDDEVESDDAEDVIMLAAISLQRLEVICVPRRHFLFLTAHAQSSRLDRLS